MRQSSKKWCGTISLVTMPSVSMRMGAGGPSGVTKLPSETNAVLDEGKRVRGVHRGAARGAWWWLQRGGVNTDYGRWCFTGGPPAPNVQKREIVSSARRPPSFIRRCRHFMPPQARHGGWPRHHVARDVMCLVSVAPIVRSLRSRGPQRKGLKEPSWIRNYIYIYIYTYTYIYCILHSPDKSLNNTSPHTAARHG